LKANSPLPTARPSFILSGMEESSESVLWETTPSQWLNIWQFAGAAILAIGGVFAGISFFPPAWFLLIPAIAWAVWRFLVVRCQRYRLTSERIRITTGVLNQKIDEIELYRVKDINMTRPFWMRLTGLSTVHLKTSDRSLPRLEIPAVHKGDDLREALRRQVEKIRDRKRVREMDFDSTHSDPDGLDDDLDFDDTDLGG
jgi:uncharacterized membrane protein YdbT with pleckstrin-like domain